MFKAEYLFLRILIPFIAGILIFYSLAEMWIVKTLWFVVLFVFTWLFTGAVYYQKLVKLHLKGVSSFFLNIFFLFFGGALCLLNNETLRSDYFTKTNYHTLRVYIVNEPEFNNGIARLKVRTQVAYHENLSVHVSGYLSLAVKLDSLKPLIFNYGDELLLRAKVIEIEPPRNPHEFNYKAWLANQNIFHQAFTAQNKILKTGINKGNPIIRYALELRRKMVSKYQKLLSHPEAIGIASTLILGYRAQLDQEIMDIYSRTGTIHALSVSGAHVGLIYAVIAFLLGFLNRQLKLRILKFVVICILIWCYAVITGLSPSVVRSAIMISVFMSAKTFIKTKNNFNILAFSAFCQLTYNPFSIFDVGFQLSYLAVLGLIYLQPKIYHLWYFKNKAADYLWNFTALSLSAQLFTFPLSVYYFHQFPLYFLFANLFITLPLALMMYLGLVVLLPGFGFLAELLDWLIMHTNSGLRWIATLPYSSFKAIWITLPQMILLYLAIALLLYALQVSKKRFLFSSVSVYALYVVLISFTDIKNYQQKRIIFYSLKRNYAAAFISGRKAIVVTGLKTTDRNFSYFVKPALDESQVDSVTVINAETDTVAGDFVLSNHQLIFDQYKLLLIDKSFSYKTLAQTLSFSGIWLRNNTNFDLSANTNKINFSDAIIDASNSDNKIESFLHFDWNKSAKIFVLKKNTAYLVNLKP
ncbi:ComEC/Rec2 family competence protein [Pedobacter sp. AW1-32]|uniref:ComEC/Rec2 family competence protein n=1 Tax=Pedobacter sp. AW1-32 TaxID=3383026 RepID=UPI003FED89F7